MLKLKHDHKKLYLYFFQKLLPLLVALLLHSFFFSLSAQVWEGNISDDWFTPGNWDTNVVPDLTDDVFVDLIIPNATVITTGNAQADDIFIGNNATGQLSIFNGANLNSDRFARIANNAMSMGTVSVSGNNAGIQTSWDVGVDLEVANSGIALLNINQGALVDIGRDTRIGDNAGSMGTTTVTGTNNAFRSTLDINRDFEVGNNGQGSLNVLVGALVDVGRDSRVGDGISGIGTVTVEGTSAGFRSTVDVNRDLEIGNSGQGTLNILDGALVNVGRNVRVADNNGSSGTITVNGVNSGFRSTWDITGTLEVGDNGQGTLNILDGALVNSNNDGRIGDRAGSIGLVTVDGVTSGFRSSWIIGDDAFIGFLGQGTLNIQNGGIVSVNDDVRIGDRNGSVGIVNVTGSNDAFNSTWTIGDDVRVGDGGTGTLNINNGGQVSSDDAFVGIGGSATGTVNISDMGSLFDVIDDITVGASGGDGVLTISNNAIVQSADTFIATNNGATGIINIGNGGTPGELNTSRIVFSSGTAMLNFNHTDTSGNFIFNTDISSTGSVNDDFINHVSGFTNYTGNGSNFRGTTTLIGGIFNLDGSLRGTININGGTFSGTGNINNGNITVDSGGSLAPGNGLGTLSANATDLTFNSGSRFEIDVNDADSDMLTITGGGSSVTINGGDVIVSGSPIINTTYTILSSPNVSGVFDSVNDSIFVDYELSYDPSNVFLTANSSGTTPVSLAQTRNQRAVADALNSANPDNESVAAVFGLTSDASVREAYDALSGEIGASVKSSITNTNRAVMKGVNRRLQSAFNHSSEPSQTLVEEFTVYAFGDDGLATSEGFWIEGISQWESVDERSNTAKTNSWTGGFSVGKDWLMSTNGNDWTIGMMGSYAYTNVDVNGRDSTSHTNSYMGGIYLGTYVNQFKVKAGAFLGYHETDASREVVVGNVSDELDSDFDAISYSGFVEYSLPLPKDPEVELLAAISHVTLDTESYDESGGSSALSASSETSSTTFTTLGVRTNNQFTEDDSVLLNGLFGWRHAFGDRNPNSTYSLAGSDNFTIRGAQIAKDAAIVELGVQMKTSKTGTLSLFYGGELSGKTQLHSGNINFSVRF
ncbi:MAG: autotransporter domain-containing protein [Pseudomonadota bacterium]